MSTTNPTVGEAQPKPEASELQIADCGSQIEAAGGFNSKTRRLEGSKGDERLGEVFDKVQDALRHVRRAMDAVEAAAGKHPWSPPSLVGVWPDLNEITHRLQDAANEAAEKQEESGVAA